MANIGICIDCNIGCYGVRCMKCLRELRRQTNKIDWSNKEERRKYLNEKYRLEHIPQPIKWTEIIIKPKIVMSKKPFFWCPNCREVIKHIREAPHWRCGKCNNANRPKRVLIRKKEVKNK